MSAPDTPSVCPTCDSTNPKVRRYRMYCGDPFHAPAAPGSSSMRPATADDVLNEVETRLRDTEWSSHAEDRERVALLHIDAYREGRARAPIPAPGSPTPDTAALVARLRHAADTSDAGKGEWYQLIYRCREGADALEAQAARIAELEAAIAERNSLIGWLIMAKSCADHGQAPVWPLPARLEDLFQQLTVSMRDDWDDWRWRSAPIDHTLTTPTEESP